jgi:hypothetical protein
LNGKRDTLGVLLLDTQFPRIPGDVGNELSYDYPVVFRTVPGASVQRVVYEADALLLDEFIIAARELESLGATAITSSCGFLSPFQKDIARAMSVPVFLSSLLQVPLVRSITGGRVGVITANSDRLVELVLLAAGIGEEIPLAIGGLEKTQAFSGTFLNNGTTLQKAVIEKDVLETARELLDQYADISAFVFECHNLAPYSLRVHQETRLPVFDNIDFSNWVMSSITKRSYAQPGENK